MDRGPVHHLDAGRYRAVVREGVPMIERVDTAGAVTEIEDDSTGTATTQLWSANVEATFEADDAREAAAVAERLAERVLEHPRVWSVEGSFEDEQATEVVDG